jgi:zinc protease
VIGSVQDLLSITTERLQEYFKANYSPANAALVLVGDFDPDRALGLIRKAYGALPATRVLPRKVPAEPEQNEERRLVLRDKVASERLAEAYHVTSAEQEDSYALDVLANVLFEGTGSRAVRRLVEERELVTGVSGSAFTPTFPGLFIVLATMRSGIRAETVERELERLIAEVQERGVTEEEIQVAVRQLTVQLVDGIRTPYGMGQLIGTVQTIFGDPQRFAQDLVKYTRVTASDVRRVAQRYLIPNNRSVVVMVPRPPETATARASAPRRKGRS